MLIASVWYVGFVGLALACLVGLLLSVFQLPGTWLILLDTIGYAWHGDFKEIDLRVLIILGLLSVAGELIELLPSMMMARRAGASRRAAWSALAGGFLGMFLLSLPLPIIGTVAGGILGCFAGALAAELTVRDDVDGAVRVGLAAAAGRVVGIIGKLMVAMAMAGLAVGAAIW